MVQRIRRRSEPQSRGTSRGNRHPHGATGAATASPRGAPTPSKVHLSSAGEPRSAPGDPAQGPSTRGTLGSGYSSGSSTEGTGTPNQSDALAVDGVAAGAAGVRRRIVVSRFKPGASGDEEEEEGMDGGATVVGVAGVSGGGRGTTSSGNTRR